MACCADAVLPAVVLTALPYGIGCDLVGSWAESDFITRHLTRHTVSAAAQVLL